MSRMSFGRGAPLQRIEAANLAAGGSATAHSSEVLHAVHLDRQPGLLHWVWDCSRRKHDDVSANHTGSCHVPSLCAFPCGARDTGETGIFTGTKHPAAAWEK
jgi:hypothetical protein